MAVGALERSLKTRNTWMSTQEREIFGLTCWFHPVSGYTIQRGAEFSSNIWNRSCIHFHHHSSARKQINSSACHGSYHPALRMGTFRPHHFHLIAWQCCWDITADFANILITLCQLELIIRAKGSTRPKYMSWLIAESLEKGMSCMGTIWNMYKMPVLGEDKNLESISWQLWWAVTAKPQALKGRIRDTGHALHRPNRHFSEALVRCTITRHLKPRALRSICINWQMSIR